MTEEPTTIERAERGGCCLQRVVTPPTPYHSENGITIYCGDNRQILPLLGQYDLLLTDPPYGIGADNRKRILSRGKLAAPKDYGESNWDGETPADWVMKMALSKAQWQILWGGNYYGLPASSCWLVWDKLNGDNDFADCELAWTNLTKAVRRITHLWNGMIRKNGEERYHPTQKPLDVMTWCLGQVPEAKTVLDPWMGSGTTLVAAKLRGLEAVGIEIDEQHCETAKRRLAQGVLLAV
jgi:DNA modification methylase